MITHVHPKDARLLHAVDALLARSGLRREQNLDATLALLDEEGEVIATGSCYGNTLRCFAVDERRQGEGLLGQILSALIELSAERGHMHLFLYTKIDTARYFRDLGFYEIARVDGTLVFMENRRNGFSAFLADLRRSRRAGTSAALVMNANPFTLGHQYLCEQAAAACDTLHLFVLSEDASLIPYAVRRALVEAGTRHLPNVLLHDAGPYVISNATFPSYFLPDAPTVIEGHARLDLAIFLRIAQALDVSVRYVGEEPESLVTGAYNRIMRTFLPEAGVACVVLPRLEAEGRPISAGTVRERLAAGDLDGACRLMPETSARFFRSPEAEPVLARLRAATTLRHY